MGLLALTAVRLVIGVEALILAIEGDNLVLAATLITITIVLGMARSIARDRTTPSAFNDRFHVLVGYLTLVVTPWVLTRALLTGRRNITQELLFDAPLVAGAVAGARDEDRGLSPAFMAGLTAAAVFLHVPDLVAGARLTAVVPPLAALLAVLMALPVRYARVPVTVRAAAGVALAAMPFAAPELLAGVVVAAGALYAVVGPFVLRKSGAARR